MTRRGSRLWLLAVACALLEAVSASTQQRSHGRMNPIRKVVNLLMGMQKKVEAQGKLQTELYDKFMCNAKTVSAGLQKSIDDGKEKVPQLESGIKEVTAEHQQLAEDLKQAQEDRAAAKKALATATSIREKEAAEFAKESANQKADISACKGAVQKLKGGGSFLQTKTSAVLRKIISKGIVDLSDVDRDLLSNFLQNGESARDPSSGEILGILQQMETEMEKDLKQMEADEDGAIADFEALTSAKNKEVAACTKAIEVKTGRKGSLAVTVTKLKNDLEDAQESLSEDAAFLAETKKSADLKEKEFDAYKKTLAEELVALADTVKLLNDDDALDLFKKTLPSPSAASFVQIKVTSKQMKRDALKALHRARRHGGKGHGDHRLDLLSLALRGRKGGSFGEVIAKIDKLVGNLKKEQAADSSKKEWCITEIDKTEEEVKWTARTVSDVEKVLASSKEDLKAVLKELTAITASIKELDSAVEAATKQRKMESDASNNELAQNGAAKSLLEMAQKRLNKFYNPELTKGPKKEALAQMNDAELVDHDSGDEEQAPAFVQVSEHSAVEDESESDSEDESAVSDKDEETTSTNVRKQSSVAKPAGVLEMLNILKSDLDKAMTEIETEEKDAQKDYEVFMKDSSEKRAIDSKTVADKEAAKAKVETQLQKSKVKLKGEQESLVETKKEVYDLHNDCDWLLKNFDARKKAREDEAEALSESRAVLSGADYS